MRLTREETNKLTEYDLLEKNNVVKLETITGGKGPPSDCWLKDLKIGTIFLSRAKGVHTEAIRSFFVGEFAIYNISPDRNMYLMIEAGAPKPMWIDPNRFCNQMDLIEVLKVTNFEEGEEDGSDRTVQP